LGDREALELLTAENAKKSRREREEKKESRRKEGAVANAKKSGNNIPLRSRRLFSATFAVKGFSLTSVGG
jgi:hypothetical protein